MRRLHAIYLAIASFACAAGCAAAVSNEAARSVVASPTSGSDFEERRAMCEHFRGEGGYDADRARFLARKVAQLCFGSNTTAAPRKAHHQAKKVDLARQSDDAPTAIAKSNVTTEQVAAAQLETALALKDEAAAIVEVQVLSVSATDARAGATELQEYRVTGRVINCFKGSLKIGTPIVFGIFSEGRNANIEKNHIVFLKYSGYSMGAWVSLDGPVFSNTDPFKAGLRKMLPDCAT